MDSAAVNSGTENSKKASRMIVVCSAVGGAGKTAVAVNLAALLSERGTRTTIADADLQFGDVALALDLVPYITIKEAAEQRRIGAIRDFCIDHKSGIRVLAAPVRPEFAELVTAADLQQAVAGLREETEALIVDTAPGLAEHNLLLLEQADDIIVVTTPGMAALKNTRLMIETLAALGLRQNVRLIVNKTDAPTLMDVSDVPELLNFRAKILLPDDPKRVNFSMDTGVPLVFSHPLHSFSRQMRKLADAYYPAGTAEDKGVFNGLKEKMTAKRIRGEKDESFSEAAIEKYGSSHHS
ncbi:AAA family ATPase [Indiicoccus explosivorum]|uniref:AAA family ATPase n=1 Tax=Indiicoccus explosivorum TaxID=1917864 RepID=UPI000B443750|nr:P-loop NTPase [Indiicoccus explosivorum]